MNTEEKILNEFQNKSLKAYCELSEKEGFLFKKNDGFKSKDEANGYCLGFQNGYKKALIDMNKTEIKRLKTMLKNDKDRV